MKSKRLFGKGLFVLASIFCLVCLISAAKSEATSCRDKCSESYNSCCDACDGICAGEPEFGCVIGCQAACSKKKSKCDKGCASAGEAAQKGPEIWSPGDKDKDGFLSKDEFRAMAKEKKKDANADKEFDAIDKNKDGKLSLEEAEAVPSPAKTQGKPSPKKDKK